MLLNLGPLALFFGLLATHSHAHPHNLKPLGRASPASPIPIMMWATRNTELNNIQAPDSPMFKHLRRSQHAAVGTVGAAPIKEIPDDDDEEETKTTISGRGEVEHVEVPLDVNFDDSHAFDVIQHAPLPNGLPRGFIGKPVGNPSTRRLMARKQLMARMEQLARAMADMIQDNDEDSSHAPPKGPRFPSYSSRPPTRASFPRSRSIELHRRAEGSPGLTLPYAADTQQGLKTGEGQGVHLEMSPEVEPEVEPEINPKVGSYSKPAISSRDSESIWDVIDPPVF